MNLITEDNRKWWVLIALSIMSVLINLDVTVVNLAIPEIARYMRTSLTTMQWVGNIFGIAATLFFVLSGRLADVIGCRKVFLTGMVAFLIASIICGAAMNIPMLLLGRFFQGFGFAFCLPIIVVIVRNIFPEHRWGFVLGLVGTIAGMSQAIGPTVGGFILHYFSWRWAFYINIPFCLLSLLLLRLSYRKNDATRDESIDYLGVAILGISTISLMYAINQITVLGLKSPIFWGLILLFVIMLFVFHRVEKKQVHPLVDFSLFKIRNYTIILMMRPLQMIFWGSIMFLTPIYLVNILDFTEIKTGFIMLAMTLVFGLSAPPLGKLSDKFGPKNMLILCGILACITYSLFLQTNATGLTWHFYAALVLQGLVVGLLFVNTVRIAMTSLPAEKAGTGTGVFYTLISLGFGLGIASGGSILTYVSHQQLDKQLKSLGWIFSGAKHTWLMNAVNGTRPLHEVAHHFPAHQFHRVLPIIGESFMQGFHAVMYFNLGVAAITLGLAFLLRESTGPASEHVVSDDPNHAV